MGKTKFPIYLLLFLILALSLDINLVIIDDYKNILYALIIANLFYVLGKYKLRFISIYKKKYLIILILLLIYVGFGTVLNKLNGSNSSYFPFLINVLVLVTILCLDSTSVIKTLNITINKLFYFALIINLPIFYVGIDRGTNIWLNTYIHGSVPFFIPLLVVIPLIRWDLKKFLIGVAINLYYVFFIPKTTTIIIYFIDALILFGLLTEVLKYFKTIALGLTALLAFSFSFFFSEIVTFSINFKNFLGSSDNSPFRIYLWALAINRGNQNPIWGDFFSNDTSFFVANNQLYLPAHNDYLELYANGGISALSIFAVFIILIAINQIRTILSIRESNKNLFKIYIVIFIAFINILIQMAFNPVINYVPWGLPSFFLIGVLLSFEDYVKSN